MDPQERLWKCVEWGAALIVGVALLVSTDVLPAGAITITGNIFVDRVISVSLVAMFATVLGTRGAKVVAKVFQKGFL